MKKARVASIDILRALTMVLMIWVNDFWSLTEIPKWLKHASATEDYLGFSDIIFPLFLFIVGLSIPFAIQQRKLSGASTFSTTKHIIIRSVSLLIIGVYMVNYESAHHESLLIGKPFWTLLMASAVVLIWMDWKRSPVPKKWHIPIQLSSFLILIFLAIIYKGGPTGELWMRTQWWGILGLIGWAYAINALVYLFSKGNVYIMVSLMLIFNALAVLTHAELLPELKGFSKYFSTIYKGTIPAFTAAGIVASLVYKRLFANHSKLILGLALIGIIFVGYGFLMRPLWGISKIQGTPAWIGICTGIGFLSFAVFYYIADVKKQTNWAKIIAPAGTATLTCYLIPYFVYPIRNLNNFRFPDFLNAGIIGLLGSLGFALLVVIFTGWMERKGFKLKL
jgi:predicted acyltransferase